MCGRYILGEKDIDVIEQRFLGAVTGHHKWHPRYNVAPSQAMPVVVPDELIFLPWGFRPTWATRRVINARLDSLNGKPYFRDALHCIVPATGFYEWKQSDGTKQPYMIRPEHAELFGMAGLYNKDGFAIVTREATGDMCTIHARMPVLLTRDQEHTWLATGAVTPTDVSLLMYPVSPAVNNPRNDSAGLLERVET